MRLFLACLKIKCHFGSVTLTQLLLLQQDRFRNDVEMSDVFTTVSQ
jgi:hypothetical protein